MVGPTLLCLALRSLLMPSFVCSLVEGIGCSMQSYALIYVPEGDFGLASVKDANDTNAQHDQSLVGWMSAELPMALHFPSNEP